MIRLNSYKVVKYLKKYIKPQKVKTLIVICSCTAQRWQHKLGFEKKDIKKDVFIERHRWPGVIKYRNNFLRLIDELKWYNARFQEYSIMKLEKYPLDCIVEDEERWPIIVITHNECNFSANTCVPKVQTRIDDTNWWHKLMTYFCDLKDKVRVLWL